MHNEYTREDVEKVYNWQNSRTNCFSDLLFDLMMKADQGNSYRLSVAFPNLHAAWKIWYGSQHAGDDFFREYKVGRFGAAQ